MTDEFIKKKGDQIKKGQKIFSFHWANNDDYKNDTKLNFYLSDREGIIDKVHLKEKPHRYIRYEKFTTCTAHIRFINS